MAVGDIGWLGSQCNGLNHVGMNLGEFDRAAGPVGGTNYPTYPDALLDWYQANNVKSVRFLFTWEAIQSTLSGVVPAIAGGYADYWADLIDVLMRLLQRNIYVILAPWQYNPASHDTDIVYDGASFTSADFADFWGKFATAINGVSGNDQRVAFDLINEPHEQNTSVSGDKGISINDWFTYAQVAIDAIRAAGATNTIFVPGMDYAAASSFTTNGSATQWLGLTDPLANIAVTAHCYDGLGSASPTVLQNAYAALVSWAQTNILKVNIGEIALDAGYSGFCNGTTAANPRSDFATAQAQWNDWNSFCLSNTDVLVGWNWWANSAECPWWDAADSADGSHWGLTLDNGTSQTPYMDLIGWTF